MINHVVLKSLRCARSPCARAGVSAPLTTTAGCRSAAALPAGGNTADEIVLKAAIKSEMVQHRKYRFIKTNTFTERYKYRSNTFPTQPQTQPSISFLLLLGLSSSIATYKSAPPGQHPIIIKTGFHL
jgi:hypothetical protein